MSPVDFRCCPFFSCSKVLKIAAKTALKMREFPFQRPKNLKISRWSLPPDPLDNSSFALAPDRYAVRDQCPDQAHLKGWTVWVMLHLLLLITRKYTIINANLKLKNAKIHSIYSIDIH